jgi:hypothetical protein
MSGANYTEAYLELRNACRALVQAAEPKHEIVQAFTGERFQAVLVPTEEFNYFKAIARKHFHIAEEEQGNLTALQAGLLR